MLILHESPAWQVTSDADTCIEITFPQASTKFFFSQYWLWVIFLFFQISASAPSSPQGATWRGTKYGRRLSVRHAGWLPRWWSRWVSGRAGSHHHISSPITLSRRVAKANGSHRSDAPQGVWMRFTAFARRCEATISKQIFGVLESQP